jgi:chromosome segregation ATPase
MTLKSPSDHPLADIMGAIDGLRALVEPIPKEMRHLGTRMSALEGRQEAAERKAERAETVATGASRRVSELELRHNDVTTAMGKHVDSLLRTSKELVHVNEGVASTSKELVESNQKQNVELDRQTGLLLSIRKWTPVIVAVGALLGAILGAGVSAYYQAKTFTTTFESGHR